MIVLEQVTVQRQGVIALNHFTHTIHPGQSVAVIGPSGSGKTTLLEAIATLLPICCTVQGIYTACWATWSALGHHQPLIRP